MFTTLHLITFPSGRFGFAGRVPVVLGMRRKDGAPMTAQDCERAAQCNAPAMLGYVTRAYTTRDEAIAAACALGYWITEHAAIVAHDGKRIAVRTFAVWPDGSIQYRTDAHTDAQSEGYSRGGWTWDSEVSK
jgi:hypothetical protein